MKHLKNIKIKAKSIFDTSSTKQLLKCHISLLLPGLFFSGYSLYKFSTIDTLQYYTCLIASGLLIAYSIYFFPFINTKEKTKNLIFHRLYILGIIVLPALYHFWIIKYFEFILLYLLLTLSTIVLTVIIIYMTLNYIEKIITRIKNRTSSDKSNISKIKSFFATVTVVITFISSILALINNVLLTFLRRNK